MFLILREKTRALGVDGEGVGRASLSPVALSTEPSHWAKHLSNISPLDA